MNGKLWFSLTIIVLVMTGCVSTRTPDNTTSISPPNSNMQVSQTNVVVVVRNDATHPAVVSASQHYQGFAAQGNVKAPVQPGVLLNDAAATRGAGKSVIQENVHPNRIQVRGASFTPRSLERRAQPGNVFDLVLRDGRRYEQVQFDKKIGLDKILITYKKGIANILITDLPDAVRTAWRLPSDEEINAAKMAQKRFVEEQQAKGLVLYRDNWITPTQKISIETQEADAARASKPSQPVREGGTTDGGGAASTSYTNGLWTTIFKGRTISLQFSNGSGIDGEGYKLSSVSATLWNGQRVSGGKHILEMTNGKTAIGIMMGGNTQGLGWFIDSTHLLLGWDDGTYGGHYCGELIFTRQ